MRLIDAKQLEKQVKEAFETLNPVLMGQTLRWIRKQKTIDAVPVVRCENCINKERADINASCWLVPYSCTRPLVLSFTYSLSIIILLSAAQAFRTNAILGEHLPMQERKTHFQRYNIP